jgi:hypothetical protein
MGNTNWSVGPIDAKFQLSYIHQSRKETWGFTKWKHKLRNIYLAYKAISDHSVMYKMKPYKPKIYQLDKLFHFFVPFEGITKEKMKKKKKRGFFFEKWPIGDTSLHSNLFYSLWAQKFNQFHKLYCFSTVAWTGSSTSKSM